MTRRMNQALTAALILAVGTGVIICMYARRHLLSPERKDAVVDDTPVCHPEGIHVPWLGWPNWRICEDSTGFHTCWRPLDHSDRHCEWDLATGHVTAVWPCTELPQIADVPFTALMEAS